MSINQFDGHHLKAFYKLFAWALWLPCGWQVQHYFCMWGQPLYSQCSNLSTSNGNTAICTSQKCSFTKHLTKTCIILHSMSTVVLQVCWSLQISYYSIVKSGPIIPVVTVRNSWIGHQTTHNQKINITKMLSTERKVSQI